MKPLLTDDQRAALPALYATENDGGAAVVRARLFAPGTEWQWFVIELDPEEPGGLCFGLVAGLEVELGYFLLAELEEAGYVLRDDGWRPRPLAAVRARLDAERAAADEIDLTPCGPEGPGDGDESGR